MRNGRQLIKGCFFDHVYIAYCAIRDAHDFKLRNDLVSLPILLIFDVQKLFILFKLIIFYAIQNENITQRLSTS